MQTNATELWLPSQPDPITFYTSPVLDVDSAIQEVLKETKSSRWRDSEALAARMAQRLLAGRPTLVPARLTFGRGKDFLSLTIVHFNSLTVLSGPDRKSLRAKTFMELAR